MMVWIIIVFVIILIGLLYRYQKRKVFKSMLEAANTIKFSVYVRLVPRYEKKYNDEEFAKYLAVSISNALFSSPTKRREAENFFKKNKETIRLELFELRHDREICYAVTQAVRVLMISNFAYGKKSEGDISKPLERLNKFKILVPGGEAPSPETFIPFAQEFYNDSKEFIKKRS